MSQVAQMSCYNQSHYLDGEVSDPNFFLAWKHCFLFCVNAIVPLWNCIGNKSNLKIKIIQGGILNKLRRPIVIGSAASESQCSKYSDLNMKHEFFNDSDR